MYILFTDTDTDITKEVAEEYGYHLISMPYTVGDKTVYPYLDFDKFDSHEFYEMLRGGVLPTTSALNPYDYTKIFEPFLKAGQDILYVHFSAAMSGTFNSLNIAIQELKEKYPERNIYLLDTKGITIGAYNIVLEVGDMYKSGKSIEEILEWGKTEVDKFAIYFFADDLKFFAKSGRVGGFSAFMGNVFGIKPIIYMGSDGKMTSCGKAKGRLNAIELLLNYMCELGEDLDKHRIIIASTDAEYLANELKAKIIEKFGPNLRIEMVQVNPTAGSHCGPDGVGVSFHAIHR